MSLDIGERFGDVGVVGVAEHLVHQSADGATQRHQERAHGGHRRVSRARQPRVVVEAARDDGDADGGSLEAWHDVLVAAEHVDVAPIADVPPGNLAALADGLEGLTDQSLTRRARLAPPTLGLVR